MKLAIITNYWINSDGGGIREYTKNLVQHLKNTGVGVVVIFREGEDESQYKMPSNHLKFIFRALKVLKKERPDAILCQGPWFVEIPAIIFKKMNRDTKVLMLFHNHRSRDTSTYHKVKIVVYNNILRHFDAVGFVSKGLEKNIKNIAGYSIKSKTFILYAGVQISPPTEKEIDNFKYKYDIYDNNFYLLAHAVTATHVKKESTKLLLRSFKEVLTEIPNARLIITRKGKYQEELMEYSEKLGISDSVIFTGDLKNPDVATSVSDIYTSIFLDEYTGVSLSLLEAMAYGKPVVASKFFSEAIIDGFNGILVDNNEREISEAIIRLIRDERLREKLGANAKKYVHSKFNWDKTAKKLIETIKSV